MKKILIGTIFAVLFVTAWTAVVVFANNGNPSSEWGAFGRFIYAVVTIGLAATGFIAAKELEESQ